MPTLPDGTPIHPIPNACNPNEKRINDIYTILDDIQENCCVSNLPPTIVPGEELPDQLNEEGSPIQPVLTSQKFEDSDGTIVSYSATGLPASLSIDPTTGEITGTPDVGTSTGGANSDGVYQIVVTATDDAGDSVDCPFVWTITEEPVSNFYLNGDANEADVGADIKQAFADGESVGISDALGNFVQAVTSPAELSTYAAGLSPSATVDPLTCAITYADGSSANIPVCFEEQVCGFAPQVNLLNLRDVDNTDPDEHIKRETGSPFEGSLNVFSDAFTTPIAITGENLVLPKKWVRVNPPRLRTDGISGTVSSADGSLVCEPECIQQRFELINIDEAAEIEIFNPQDVISITTNGGTGGTWTQNGNVYSFTHGPDRPFASMIILMDCDTTLEFSVDFLGNGFDAIPTRQRLTFRPPALLTYLCDPANGVSVETIQDQTVTLANFQLT